MPGGALPRVDARPHVHDGLPLPSRDKQIMRTDLDGDGREELVLFYRAKFHPKLDGLLRVVRLPPG